MQVTDFSRTLKDHLVTFNIKKPSSVVTFIKTFYAVNRASLIYLLNSSSKILEGNGLAQ